MKRLLATNRSKIIAGLVLIGVFYLGAGIMYWRNYDSAMQNKQSLATELRKALKTPAVTATERAQALQSLQTTTDKLIDEPSFCEPVWWAKWMSGITGYGDAQARCLVTANKQIAVKKISSRLSSYVSDERKIISSVKPLSRLQSKLTDKTWGNATSTWAQVEKAVRATDVSTSFRPVKQKLLVNLVRVNTAWETLLKADKKKDKTAYLAAFDSLDRAISDVAGVSETNEDTLKPLLKRLSELTAAL